MVVLKICLEDARARQRELIGTLAPGDEVVITENE